MGTNFYLHYDVCEHCRQGKRALHIGKSSVGWKFSLHVVPWYDMDDGRDAKDGGIDSLEKWQAEWAKPGTRISNEYDPYAPISIDEMMEIITERTHPSGELMAHHPGKPDPRSERNVEPGPPGSTYDLVTGEFS